MAADPTVSLVVLNWNGRDFLAECLESLAAIDYLGDRLELVLCDNGSDDGSIDLVRERFPGFRIVALDHNHGFAEGNDLAAAEATGDWVGFLNNDMVVPPTWLRDMLAPLDRDPDIACLASRIMSRDGATIDFIGGGIDFLGHGLQLDHGAMRSEHDRARRLLFACGGAMLIRRELFLEVGGFDPSYFAFFEDVDLGWRLNLLGHDVWYTPQASALHRHHGTAQRLGAHQLRTLSERNALFTIYKNYDDANLAAVLPVALMLLNEKALMMGGVDAAAFRVGEAPPSVPAAPPGPRRGGRASRLVETARADGPVAVVRQAARGGRRALGRAALSLASTEPPPPPPVDGAHPLPDVALSAAVAVSELAHNIEQLAEKRAWVQGRRRRGDAEVLALGRVRLEDPTFGSADYLAFQHWLSGVTGIDARFDEVKL